MNNILLFSDNHFCSNSSILRKKGNKYSLRLENQIKTINWLTEIAVQYNCSNIFCLGDFFNSPNLNAEEISALSKIDFKGIQTHFIVGNHEANRIDLKYSSAHSFLINKNCFVYNNPAILGIGNSLLYLLPYQLTKKETVSDYFPNINKNLSYKILFSHNDISGIQMGNFISKEGFSKEDLQNNFDLVINGHIHNSSWITDNIFNIGNITGQNFSEDAFVYNHNCMILDADTLNYNIIENPFAFNFYKINFYKKDIDYINEISMKIKKNAIVSIKTDEESFDYISKRFNPDIEEDRLTPRNCNIIAAKIICEKNNINVENNINKKFEIDYLKQFQDYVLNNIGNNEIILEELQSIIGA